MSPGASGGGGGGGSCGGFHFVLICNKGGLLGCWRVLEAGGALLRPFKDEAALRGANRTSASSNAVTAPPLGSALSGRRGLSASFLPLFFSIFLLLLLHFFYLFQAWAGGRLNYSQAID